MNSYVLWVDGSSGSSKVLTAWVTAMLGLQMAMEMRARFRKDPSGRS